MKKWWAGLIGEHYWMEITERNDLGADLNAPAADEKGKQNANYALVGEADDGDIVFHLDKHREAIVAHSVIRGPAWKDEVVWGARGTSARGQNVTPYARPGVRRALQHYTPLVEPISLQAVRKLESEVFSIRDRLRKEHGDALYFPFAPYKGQALRPFQGYMVKFPKDLVALLGLPAPPPALEITPAQPAGGTSSGAAYRRADEEVAVSVADPMPRDPALIERGLRGHRMTQNALADALIQVGIEPLSPSSRDPDWDIAWRSDGTLYIAEVKSLTASNEERQLRLGLGQVLRYRQRAADPRPVAVLVTERKPTDESWLRLCEQLQVQLVWPENWGRLLPSR
jgi:hypothetical protein